MAVNQFRVGLRRLTSHWKPLLLFELLWKVLTVLVIAPRVPDSSSLLFVAQS